MDGLCILKSYQYKLNSDKAEDKYAAFGFALQLPGICGRKEFDPNEPKIKSLKSCIYKKDRNSPSGYSPCDKKMFKYWFNHHCKDFAPMFLPFKDKEDLDGFLNDLYELRNKMTHEGVVKAVSKK